MEIVTEACMKSFFIWQQQKKNTPKQLYSTALATIIIIMVPYA